MGGSGRTFRWSAALALIALIAFGAQSADAGISAAGPYQYLPGGASGKKRVSVKTKCPAGTHLLSVSAFNVNGDYGETAVTSLYPGDGRDNGRAPDDFAVARMDNLTDTSKTLFIRAICAAGSYTYRAERFKVPGKQQAFGSVQCPDDADVVGGGVLAEGGYRSQYVNSTRPIDDDDVGGTADDGWQAYVDNTDKEKRAATVYAICVTPP